MIEFTFHTQENTSGQAKALLDDIQQGYGFVPNLFAYMAEAPITIKAYLAMNELISKGSFSAAQQQVALLTVSKENGCDFCITAHRAMGKLNKANQETLSAIHNDTEIKDSSDYALAIYTRKVVKQRGFVSDDDINEFIAAGFTKENVLEVVLIVSIKTLSNYINHITRPEANDELLEML
ncbi:MAG: carboxymuconolactone decarboxylase family protein [Gammaproteobacteria bacterium]|nr:carboxymuconolactone decarboxylase family protein [Gammaproteobacteria bacterium]